MPYYLTKVLPLLVMPMTLALVAIVFALVFLWRSHHRLAMLCLVFALLVLGSFSMPVVSWKLMWSLERQFPPVADSEIPPSDCLIVLGGALGTDVFPRVEPELGEAIDRVYQAARLYREGKARNIIVAAGNQPWSQSRVSEASQIQRLLVEWGVPEPAIFLDHLSKNTRENALNAADWVERLSCQSSLLVTSSSHMPRAHATFAKVGVSAFPVSVDVRLLPGSGEPVSQYLPSAEAMSASSDALREWLGIWVYRWRGWS